MGWEQEREELDAVTNARHIPEGEPGAPKRCAKCREFKSRSEFGLEPRNKDGLTFRCKECRRQVDRERRSRPDFVRVHKPRGLFPGISADMLRATAAACREAARIGESWDHPDATEARRLMQSLGGWPVERLGEFESWTAAAAILTGAANRREPPPPGSINVDSLRRRLLKKRDPAWGDGECWIWDGARSNSGYGIIGDGRRSPLGAHIASYLAFVGPIPDGLYVCHDCPGGDNKLCWNPGHLWLGTNPQNIADARAKGVPIGRPRRDYCSKGHPYSGDNLCVITHRDGRTSRRCRACRDACERARSRKGDSNGITSVGQ